MLIFLIRLELFTVTELDKIFSGNKPLMMEADMVSEMLGFYPQLTRLVAREDIIDLHFLLIFLARRLISSTIIR
jgi:hypothetical protein